MKNKIEVATTEDKAVILYNRHIKISIEWGGTDMFTHSSDMSIEGAIKLFSLIRKDISKRVFDEELSKIIEKENDIQD